MKLNDNEFGLSRRRFLGAGCMGAAALVAAGTRGRLAAAQTPAGEGESADALWNGFREPPTNARPFVRWWWNGDNVTKSEILRELDVMKAAGIGGVEINPIKFPADEDPLNIPSIEWLTPEWCEMVRVGVDGARERGMTVDIIVGSGWPFGGRFLPREHQTKILSVGRRHVSGPATVSLTEAEMFEGVDLTLHSKNDTIYQTFMFARLTPAAADRFEPGVDITDRFRDGTLTVDIPAGDHIVHYFILQEGFQAVINGAPGSDGPVLNHFSREATEFYLNHMSDGMKPTLGNLGGCFRAVFCDSLELEGANWNADMLDEFRRRRGYDLLPWLPYMLMKTGQMGNTVQSDDIVKMGPELEDQSQRVRFDYWRTLIELFRERFLEPFTAWCRAQGVQSRVQAYGHGYDPLESSMAVDIPECETWLNMHTGSVKSHGAHSVNNKFTASGARLAGKSLISCEEITNTQYVFFTPLAMVKIAGDESNLSGVTHSILHGFNYSPPETEFPGWVRYGTFFSERNPWWPFMRRWTDYKARLSWLLQHSEPTASIAILHPLADLWKRWGMQRDPFPGVWHPKYSHLLWRAFSRNGYNVDTTSEGILRQSEMRDGGAWFGARKYDTLVLMEVDTIDPETAAALERFAACGGKIVFIGRAPSVASGLTDAAARDAAVKASIGRILERHAASCRVVPEPESGSLPVLTKWVGDLGRTIELAPDVEIDPVPLLFGQLRHRVGDRDIFFLVNTDREKPARFNARFCVDDGTPWIWDPETGERRIHPWTASRQDLAIELEPGESRLIVFEKGSTATAPAPDSVPSEESPFVPSGSWRVSLSNLSGETTSMELTGLGDLQKMDGLANFGGVATYRLAFDAPAAGVMKCLDLGTVFEISEVTLNGRPLGSRWYGRHRYVLPTALKPRGNELEIRVTTIAGNYCKGLTGNPTAQKWTAKLPPRPMGLIGPIRFLRAK